VRRRLAENELKPWRKDMWCIPQVDGEFVARMENVLDLYAEAPDPKRPVVLFRREPDPAHRRGTRWSCHASTSWARICLSANPEISHYRSMIERI
jgi:hypothetical protein